MADQQVRLTEVTAAPAIYRVPDGAEFTLKSVRATFADNGATGDWLPCLTIVSDADIDVADGVDQGVKITAGDAAKVSWFPGVKPKSVASTSTGGTVWAETGSVSTVTIPAASGGSPTVQPLDMDSPLDYTNDSGVFTTKSTVIGGTTYTGPAVLQGGHYLFKAQLILSAINGAGLVSAVMISFGGTPAAYGSEGREWQSPTGGSPDDGWYMEALVTVQDSDGPFPVGPWLWQVSNDTNSTLKAFVNVAVFQLDTDQTVFF